MLKAENAHVIKPFLAQHPEGVDNTMTITKNYGLNTLDPRSSGLAIQTGEEEMDGFYYACLDKR